MRGVDLSRLIARRRSDGDDSAGSLRDMEARAQEAGHRISRSTLGEYSTGERIPDPRNETLLAALAAALDVTVDEVRAAALESVGQPAQLEEHRSQQVEAFLRLTDGRTEREIEQLLGVVSAFVKGLDGRLHMEDQ